jgi:hypothetical protein
VRNQLAELLVLLDRVDEARKVVKAAMEEGAISDGTYALRARLQSDTGALDGARKTIAEGLSKFPKSNALRNMKTTLDQGHPLRLKSDLFEALPPEVPTQDPEDPFLVQATELGRLKRLRFILDTMDGTVKAQAAAELRTFTETNVNSTYGAILKVRYGGAVYETMPSFAVSFEQALAAEDRAKLEQLSRLHPRLDALILVAQAALGDVVSEQRVEAWLRKPIPINEDHIISLLRQQIRPLSDRLAKASLRLSDDAARMRVMEILHDINDASASDRIAA